MQKLNFSRCVLLHMRKRASLKYFVSYCPWKQFFCFNSSQTPSNLISLTFLLILRTSTQFETKLRAIMWEKVLKLSLLGNCFPDLLTEFAIDTKKISRLF